MFAFNSVYGLYRLYLYIKFCIKTLFIKPSIPSAHSSPKLSRCMLSMQSCSYPEQSRRNTPPILWLKKAENVNDLILLLVLFRLLPSRPCEFSIEFHAQKPQHIHSTCKGHVLVHILPTVLVTAPYMSLGDKSPED